MWAERMNWDVPDCHYKACHWLEHRGNLAVLRCFRGFGKSTILAFITPGGITAIASTAFCTSRNLIQPPERPAAIHKTFCAITH
jgi:hypothetical protein